MEIERIAKVQEYWVGGELTSHRMRKEKQAEKLWILRFLHRYREPQNQAANGVDFCLSSAGCTWRSQQSLFSGGMFARLVCVSVSGVSVCCYGKMRTAWWSFRLIGALLSHDILGVFISFYYTSSLLASLRHQPTRDLYFSVTCIFRKRPIYNAELHVLAVERHDKSMCERSTVNLRFSPAAQELQPQLIYHVMSLLQMSSLEKQTLRIFAFSKYSGP